MVAARPETTETLSVLLGQLATGLQRHEDRDDGRFEAQRTDSEDRGRRLYERIETSEGNLQRLIETRIGELGLKVDGKVTELVRTAHELQTDATYARGMADGLKEGKTISPTRLAIIQGAVGEAVKLLITVLLAIAMLAATGWSVKHGGILPSIATTQH